MNDIVRRVLESLQRDHSTLLERYSGAILAGDRMADELGQLISQARAHRIPEHPVVDSAERALKTWRSAR